MRAKQRTIANQVSFEGVGLHTGNLSTITFCPSDIDTGYVFVRKDLPDFKEIPADVDFVTDISRGTTLTKDEASVHTVEHVLSALVGMEIDNCRIELSANEPPVGDGSALPFAECIVKSGYIEQNQNRLYIDVDRPINYINEEKEVELAAIPNDDFRATVMVDYRNPALGSQHAMLFKKSDFAEQFAPARTFCFLSEVEMLRREGLIKGGNLDNAIVIVDKDFDQNEMDAMAKRLGIEGSVVLGSTGVLNNGNMRFPNEPARHKLLDLIGDLALVGYPIRAHILAARPGHASNIEFAKKIKKVAKQNNLIKRYMEETDKPKMDINAIMNILPHRFPFLLVDRILDLNVEKGRVVALKNVTMNEPFFTGHFPSQPIMPGVLIVEAMAQAGGILLKNYFDEGNNLAFFMGINNCKFRKPVIPGDQLIFDVQQISKRFSTYTFQAKATVSGTLVAEAEITVALVKS